MSEISVVNGLATRLLEAEATCAPIDPIAAELAAKDVASAYDLLGDLKLVADPGRDVVGQAMLRGRERARPSQRKSLDNDF